MNNKPTAVVIAPQFRRGINNLRDARRERAEVIAAREEETRLENLRMERSRHVEDARVAIDTLLSGGSCDKAKAGEIARGEIRWLIGVMKSENGQDRLWAAGKILWLTAWRGMCIFKEVEDAFTEVFGDNIHDNLAEKLANLVRRDARYHGTMRPGKTARDYQSGAHKRHEDNGRVRALQQSAVAKSYEGGGKKK